LLIVLEEGIFLESEITYDVGDFFLSAVGCRRLVGVYVHKDENTFKEVPEHSESFILFSHPKGSNISLAHSIEGNIDNMSRDVPATSLGT
jgi:hypothetical protein